MYTKDSLTKKVEILSREKDGNLLIKNLCCLNSRVSVMEHVVAISHK